MLGKCRYCKTPISPQYPIVEAITGISFAAVFSQFGPTLNTFLLWILIGVCIVMCITDFKEQVIFDWVSLPMLPLGLVYSFFNIGNAPVMPVKIFNTGFSISGSFISAIIGMAIAFLIFEAISLVSKLLIKNRAFGEGDTVVAMIFGAWFGWKAVVIAIILGVIVQAVFTFPLLIKNLFKLKDKIATKSFLLLVFAAVLPLILNRFEFFNTFIGCIILALATL